MRNELYKCDPRKNKKCRKGPLCQTECFWTNNREASKDGKRYVADKYTGKIEEVDY